MNEDREYASEDLQMTQALAVAFCSRLRYICDAFFRGDVPRMERELQVPKRTIYRILRRKHVPSLRVIAQILRGKCIRPEWLFRGEGAPGYDRPELAGFELPKTLNAAHPVFDTSAVVCPPESGKVTAPVKVADVVDLAQAVYAARVNYKPVIVYLDGAAALAGVGAAVVEFMRRGYVTGVACSASAAQHDFCFARFGRPLSSRKQRFPAELEEFHHAARLAATNGIGYGEALGRWCYPPTKWRKDSFIAEAVSMTLPVTVHVAIGDTLEHYYPTSGNAEFGAALGAASYTDLLVFTAQAQKMGGTPGGVFIAVETDSAGSRMFECARTALATNSQLQLGAVVAARLSENLSPPGDCALSCVISGEYQRTLSALLSACDAVYEGVVDGK